jgi:hypothetical protein
VSFLRSTADEAGFLMLELQKPVAPLARELAAVPQLDIENSLNTAVPSRGAAAGCRY